jgi:hypothetical protein
MTSVEKIDEWTFSTEAGKISFSTKRHNESSKHVVDLTLSRDIESRDDVTDGRCHVIFFASRGTF